jgi:hypothetical protein
MPLRCVSPSLTALQFHEARISIAICATNTRVFIIEENNMPEVHSVFIQIEAPKGDFEGRVAEG